MKIILDTKDPFYVMRKRLSRRHNVPMREIEISPELEGQIIRRGPDKFIYYCTTFMNYNNEKWSGDFHYRNDKSRKNRKLILYHMEYAGIRQNIYKNLRMLRQNQYPL